MPCLNEAETIAVCIDKAHRAFAELGIHGEVLVADNGSTDGSIEIAREHGARVVHVDQKGYGMALRGGIAAAEAPWIVMGDADDSYDFSDLTRFVERLRAGDELVMGCRLPGGGGTVTPGAMPFLHRWLGNPVLSTIGRVFFRCPVHDFHCGMRGFRKDAIDRLNLRTAGMEFASEMVIKATLYGLRIGEVPITLHPDGRSRPPHLRTWRDGWRHLRFMLLFSPTWLFMIPGLALLLAGVVGAALVQPGPFVVGHIRFESSTLLVAYMSVIIGAQALFFGVITRQYSAAHGLMPAEPWVEKLARWVSLERGVIAGALLGLGGLALLAYAILAWQAAGFGNMDYQHSMRRIIPAVSLIMLGVQVVFNSFFASVVSLRYV